MCWCTVLLEGVKVKQVGYPHNCMKVIVLGVFVATMLKLQQFVINEPDKIRHRRRAAIHSASLLGPVATSQVCRLLAAHYDVNIT